MTSTGHSVTVFTVAVNRRHRVEEKPDADFFRVTVWDKLADLCKENLSKGKKAAVIGSVSVSTYTTSDGVVRASLDVMANEVKFLSPKERPEENEGSGYINVDNEDWLNVTKG